VDRPRKDLGTLPTSPTSFIDRQDTIARLRESLVNDRLLTILGPGGCGKTRLALEAARRALPSFPDGAFFVDFSGVSDPGLVPSAVSQALALVQPPEAPLRYRPGSWPNGSCRWSLTIASTWALPALRWSRPLSLVALVYEYWQPPASASRLRVSLWWP
jgi:hypothetical protein